MRAAVRSFVRRGRVVVRQRQQVFRASPALSSPVATALQSCCFSTETKATEEKPIIPGIGKGKTSTGLVRFRATTWMKLLLALTCSCLYLNQVGLPVEHDWYNVMLKKFQALLDKMEASDMPETAQYRIDVTKWCNYVIKTVKENPDDPEAVEDAVQMGQVEELIDMADDEMICLDTYLETRMWELVAQYNPTVDFNPNPMRDPFEEEGNEAEQEAIRKGNEIPGTGKE